MGIHLQSYVPAIDMGSISTSSDACQKENNAMCSFCQWNHAASFCAWLIMLRISQIMCMKTFCLQLQVFHQR